MKDSEFGLMAYREGNVARIRSALLDSAKAGGIQERAEESLVAFIRANPSTTEAAWLKRYDDVRADIWLHGSSNKDERRAKRIRSIRLLEILCEMVTDRQM